MPIVRQTGGLADTITEFNPETGEGTGFRFDEYDPVDFQSAVDRALAVWPNRKLWTKLMRNGMKQDFSWNLSASKYMQVYTGLHKSSSDF